METKKLQPHFECKNCDYVSSRKSSYDKHLLTLKHKSFQMETKSCTELICTKCGKVYKTRSGIWKHEKECKVAPPVSMQKVLETNNELTRIVVKQQEEHQKTQEKLMDHIKEQQKQIQELIPRIGNVININLFLNETCKDAVNWDDFIKSLPHSTNIMKTISDGIEELGMHKRPIHCFDKKQVCIKHENVWEHDRMKINATMDQTNHLLKQQWENEHPEWYKNAKDTEEYTQLIEEEINTEKLSTLNIMI
jgi:gas vesicle protein